MNDAPRNRRAFIISKKMVASIFLTGGFMFAVLYAYLLIGAPSLSSLVSSVTSVGGSVLASGGMSAASSPSVSALGRSTVFTIFILFQFWNLFNARAFSTGRSAFHLQGCKGFIGIAAAIFFGQIAIMNLVPDFFNVVPISLTDWLIAIAGTSVVLIAGEVLRLFSRK